MRTLLLVEIELPGNNIKACTDQLRRELEGLDPAVEVRWSGDNSFADRHWREELDAAHEGN